MMMKLVRSQALTLVLALTVSAQTAQNATPSAAAQKTAQADQLAADQVATDKVAADRVARQAAVAGPNLPEAATSPAQLKIILLRPTIRFEDVPAGVRSDWGMKAPSLNRSKNAPGSDEGYEHLLLTAAKSGVGSRAPILSPDALDASALDVCSKLEPLSSRLARGNVNDEALKSLTNLALLDENYAVLVQFLRLETGPGRTWDPNTGAITSSADSTLVQAALVSGKTGKVIWKGERLIRNKALKPTDAGLSKALTDLYRNFEVK